MRLVMTLKVRDEADVIEDNLRYHRALGVDFFVVTDNASVDGTSEILKRYADAGLADVTRIETGTLRDDEESWTTQMARRAATEFEADWIFHNDADELWWPLHGTIKDALEGVPADYGAVVAPRSEFVPRPDGPGSFAERMVIREARSSLQPKVAHRGDPHAVVMSQTHEVASPGPGGDLWLALRPPGRMVHRGTRGTGEDEGGDRDIRLVWAPTWPLRIFHFPLRSFDQFRRRTEIFINHGGWRDSGRFRRLRRAYEAGRLEELYAELVWNDAQVDDGIRDGQLVRDERIARFLPRCPDPLVGPRSESVAVELDGESLERERTDVELDAMRLMTRTQRFTMLQLDRARERVDVLHEKNDELRGKLNRTLGRRLLNFARRRRRRRAELEVPTDEVATAPVTESTSQPAESAER